VAQVDPLYVHHLTRFNRAMRQRNHLLRTKNLAGIESWEFEMANSSAYLTAQRIMAVSDLKTACQKLYEGLTAQPASFSIEYKTSAPIDKEMESLKKYYLTRYQTLRTREVQLGFTLTGPHKDDLSIEIDQREARFFGSEGQQRSCVAALRLAEWGRIKSYGDGIPLLLIDDIGMSLDETRLDSLLNQIQNLGQVFLTTTKELKIEGLRLSPQESYVQKE
jgi:DNA replication and repair protein RecF